MRIAWDARPLYSPQLRGIGHYAENLLRSLLDLDSTLEILLFHDGQHPPRQIVDAPSRSVGPSRGYRWQLWERLGLPWHALLSRCDILHSLANTTPPRAAQPRVVTVHDVIPYLPEFAATDSRLRHHTVVVPDAVRRAAMILTDSESSRHDISAAFRVPLERVRVIPLAVSPAFHPPPHDDRTGIVQRLGIAQPYVLALAAAARRKNTDGVLRVFKRVSEADSNIQLVLTGVDATLDETIRARMDDYGIQPSRVTRVPFVDDRTLAALYAEARAFMFLSLYEGFGLPILEAMRCGTPVICSTRSSCPEVAGDAAAMVDPADEESAAALVVELANESSCQREARRARGVAREAAFTWRRTAEATLETYRQVLQ